MATCYERFYVYDTDSGSVISSARVHTSDADAVTSYPSGEADVFGTKGRTYLVTISHADYVSRSHNCKWGCNPATRWEIPLTKKVAPPEECEQLFLVKDKNTGQKIVSAAVNANYKLDYTDSNGYARIKANRLAYLTVAVTAAGYETLWKKFNWICTYAHLIEMTPTTPPTDTQIRIVMSTPSKAKVYLDGAYKGEATTSPMFIKTTPGSHTLKFTAAGYQDLTHLVNISSGETKYLSISMTINGNGLKTAYLNWDLIPKTPIKMGETSQFQFAFDLISHILLWAEPLWLIVDGKKTVFVYAEQWMPAYKFKNIQLSEGSHTIRAHFQGNAQYYEAYSKSKTIVVTSDGTPPPDIPDISTKLSWSKEPKTSVGIGETATYKFVLKETEGIWHSVLKHETIRLLVDGHEVNVSGVTGDDGKASLTHKFDAAGDYNVRGWFKASGDYDESYSTNKTIKVTAPKSAYIVTARDLPAGKTYIVKAFEGTSIYWDPAKAYQVTSLNKTCEILRSDMATPKMGRTIKLYDENGKQIYKTPKPIRALKVTLDRLPVNVYANEGNEYRINMSHTPNTPGVNKAFDIEARLIIGQSLPAGAGQSIIFKEEAAEGQYSKIGTRDTNDFGIAKYRHPGKAEEGSYNFIAKFEHGETSCDVHTVTVGKVPSGVDEFLTPLYKWVQETFNVDEKTAKTYTYVGIGIVGVVLLGGFLK